MPPRLSTKKKFGNLELRIGDRAARTLVVLVHGFAGHADKTWGRTPQLLRSESDGRWDVGLFSYRTGLWPFGRQGVQNVAEQLSQDVRDACSNLGYRQVGLAGHSMGALIASLSATDLLQGSDEKASVNISGLLAVAAAWDSVSIATLGSFNNQLKDAGKFGGEIRARARGAFDETTRQGIWTQDVAAADDAVTTVRPQKNRSRRWLLWGHQGAVSADDLVDPRYRPIREFVEAAAKGSTLGYLRALRESLPALGVPRILGEDPTDNWVNDLYETRTVSMLESEAASGIGDSSKQVQHLSEDVTSLASAEDQIVVVTGEGGAGKSSAMIELTRVAMNKAIESPLTNHIPVLVKLDPGDRVGQISGRNVYALLDSLRTSVVVADEIDPVIGGDAHLDLLILVDGLDEANSAQLALVDTLASRLVGTPHRLLTAGRPEAVMAGRLFRVFRLDQLNGEQLVSVVRRQLKNLADEFLSWSKKSSELDLITNLGQLEMVMRLWLADRNTVVPRTTGDLHRMALPHILARMRDPKNSPNRQTPDECFKAATILSESVRPWAFAILDGGDQTTDLPELEPNVLKLAEEGGIIEHSRNDSWSIPSARWLEYFASLELQRRVLSGEHPGFGRPGNLAVWRMAGTEDESGKAVREVARGQSQILELAVAASMDAVDCTALYRRLAVGNWANDATRILRNTPTSAAQMALLDVLLDPLTPGNVVASVANAIESTAQRRTVETLTRLLADIETPEFLRMVAAKTLRGTTETNALVALSDVMLNVDESYDLRVNAASGLRNAGDRKTLKTITDAVSNNADLETAHLAMRSLVGNTTEPAVEFLAALLNDANTRPSIRSAAVRALRGNASESAANALVSIMRDETLAVGVRRRAVRSLRAVKDEPARSSISKALQDPATPQVIRTEAARTLSGSIDQDALPVLIGALNDSTLTRGFRSAAARGLEGTDDDEALQALVHVIGGTKSPAGTRKSAARALRGTTDSTTIGALVDLLRDPSLRTVARGAAAEALQGTDDKSAVKAMCEVVADADESDTVRATIVKALSGVNDVVAWRTLVDVLLNTFTARSIRTAAAIAIRNAPIGSNMAQRLQEPDTTNQSDEIVEKTIISRLRADDVPYYKWQKGHEIRSASNDDQGDK